MRKLLISIMAAALLVWSPLAHSSTIGPETWTMYSYDPSSGPPSAATILPNPVPEYHWWDGCSPTAAGMLFAYWDTYLGKNNLYDGDSSNWDKTNMNMTNSTHYDNEHNIVASWGHYQAGQAKGYNAYSGSLTA